MLLPLSVSGQHMLLQYEAFCVISHREKEHIYCGDLMTFPRASPGAQTLADGL